MVVAPPAVAVPTGTKIVLSAATPVSYTHLDVYKRQGEWKFTADYGELVHYDPNTINTGLLAAGSTTPQVVNLPGGPGTGSEYELKTKRTGLGVGFSKRVSDALLFEVDLKSENKEGSRLFGVGMNCASSIASCGSTTSINTGWALLMLPEPISANHSQVEARVTYAQDKLRLGAGYYGSFYRNDYSSLNPVSYTHLDVYKRQECSHPRHICHAAR